MSAENIRSLFGPRADGRIVKMREERKDRRDPVCPDDVLNYILLTVRALLPENILEIGAAEGLTGAAMLAEAPHARLTAIEIDEERFAAAKENFAALGLDGRARCILGDAADVLPALEGPFDMIFLDGPKAQYVHYLPDLKRLLRGGGVLVADDVLLYGWVDGSVPVPQKRHSLAERIRDYLSALAKDEDLITSVLDIGEGVAVSVKRR